MDASEMFLGRRIILSQGGISTLFSRIRAPVSIGLGAAGLNIYYCLIAFDLLHLVHLLSAGYSRSPVIIRLSIFCLLSNALVRAASCR